MHELDQDDQTDQYDQNDLYDQNDQETNVNTIQYAQLGAYFEDNDFEDNYFEDNFGSICTLRYLNPEEQKCSQFENNPDEHSNSGDYFEDNNYDYNNDNDNDKEMETLQNKMFDDILTKFF